MFSSGFVSVFLDNPEAEFSELLGHLGLSRNLINNEKNIVHYVQTELM